MARITRLGNTKGYSKTAKTRSSLRMGIFVFCVQIVLSYGQALAFDRCDSVVLDSVTCTCCVKLISLVNVGGVITEALVETSCNCSSATLASASFGTCAGPGDAGNCTGSVDICPAAGNCPNPFVEQITLTGTDLANFLTNCYCISLVGLLGGSTTLNLCCKISSIPAVSEWGLVMLAILMMVIATMYLRRDHLSRT